MSRKKGGGPPSQRQLRVGEALRHALAQILQRGEVHDPEIASRSVTVTEVRISPDLRNATCFVMPLGGGDMPSVLAALKRVAPFLRSQIGRSVPLKFTPQLSFQADRSFEEAGRIEHILRDDPVVVKDLTADHEGEADASGAPEKD